jgi:tetratricopeptide (TPR) repeat protein
MKYLLIFSLAICNCPLHAQINTVNLYKTWVLSKITYKDGSALPDENPLKYTYLKYTFESPDKFRLSLSFSEKGAERSFEIQNGYLQLKSTEGTVINTQKIEELSDKLVLLQAGNEGFDDPASLIYSFIPENVYRGSIKIKSGDIQSVFNGDTTYFESPKIYAAYKGESFQQFIYHGIADHINMHGRAAHFVATFVVSKKGIPDSVKFIENIDAEFDKRFIKVFNQAKKDWEPAVLNGKSVDVLMKVDLRYSTSETVIPAYFAAQKGLAAYNNRNYDIAEYYYDEALKSDPKDKEYLFRRGMCKMLLGNKTGACEDWNTAKALGSNSTIDSVLEKYCK